MTSLNDAPSLRKLLPSLSPDFKLWGQIQGLLTTTFDLNPEFLERDFLPSVLGVTSKSPWSTRIALERSLREIDIRAVILTEARRYRGRPRSLQLRLVPAVSSRGSVLHAKVTFVVFERAVTLVVGSANLTERGYRKNREIAAVLTASDRDRTHAKTITTALEGARTALSKWLTDDGAQVLQRALKLLQSWAPNVPDAGVDFVWSNAAARLWSDFVHRWPAGEEIHRISIVSPYWSDRVDQTVGRFLSELRRRAPIMSNAQVRLLTDGFEGNGHVMPILPSSYAEFSWESLGVRATTQAISSTIDPADVGKTSPVEGSRTLHTKFLMVEGARHALAYIGSANFTAHGWGFTKHDEPANTEAGVIIAADANDSSLAALVPPLAGRELLLTKKNTVLLKAPPSSDGDKPWPEFIREAVLRPDSRRNDEIQLEIRIDGAMVPDSWSASTLGAHGLQRLELFSTTAAMDSAAVRIRLSPALLAGC
jgi:HKD family nuclease